MNMWAGQSHSLHRGGHRPLTLTFFLAAALLIAAVLFGGASRQHAVPLAIVELVSIPLLIWGVWRLSETRGWREIAFPAAILGAIVAIPLLQLVPSPFATWAVLPGREQAAAVAQLGGVASGWRSYSLAPQETWRSALALLPAAAMFLASTRLNSRERLSLTGIVLGLALLNLLAGVAQVASGSASSLFIYEGSNRGFAVGLFANRNHYAMLLVAILPFAALWTQSFQGRSDNRRLLVAVVALLVFVVVVVGVIMGRSRAGVLLLIPSLLGAVVVIWKSSGGRAPGRTLLMIGGVVTLALAVALAFGLGPLLSRLGADQLQDVRFTAVPAIWKNALAQLPFGSGIGSFEQVYQSVEPTKLISNEFLNHAHNDYLELWLETGVLGALILTAFAFWWISSAWRALKAVGSYGDLARAGAVFTAVLLVHSLVDYPLRTPALATLFAFGCALMITPPRPEKSREAPAEARLAAA